MDEIKKRVPGLNLGFVRYLDDSTLINLLVDKVNEIVRWVNEREEREADWADHPLPDPEEERFVKPSPLSMIPNPHEIEDILKHAEKAQGVGTRVETEKNPLQFGEFMEKKEGETRPRIPLPEEVNEVTATAAKTTPGTVIRQSEHTQVTVEDHPGAGGANHYYAVWADLGPSLRVLQEIVFQQGPILEAGANGVQNEDLISIVIHRLEGFQKGEFACGENAYALIFLQEALRRLGLRTADRKRRGVEGKSVR